MPEILEGHLNGAGQRFAVIVSRFNDFITRRLLDGALDGLIRHGVGDDDITVAWVPGSFEIPFMAKKLARTGDYDAILCLGAVIRGATPHFDYVAAEVSKGVSAVALESGVPIAYGVLTTDTIEQAIERAGAKVGNKGYDAALSGLEMVNLCKVVNNVGRGGGT